MIASNEIRLGNTVQNYKGVWITIRAIDIDAYEHHTYHAVANFYSLDKLKGIQITHELLLKLGFKTGNTIDTYYRDDIGCMYLKLPHRESKHWLIKGYNDSAITTVKYLHQLQNFYYVICGQELPAPCPNQK